MGHERLWHGAEVVEADRAWDGHPVFGSALDLGVDPADGADHECDDDVRSRGRALPRVRTTTGFARVRERPGVLGRVDVLGRSPALEQFPLADQSAERRLRFSVAEFSD